jgi:hypothetical protein
MFSSETAQPKISFDSNSVLFNNNPSAAALTSTTHTIMSPIGIMTVSGVYSISGMAGGTFTGGDSSALITFLSNASNSGKIYIYVESSTLLSRLIIPTWSSGTATFTYADALTGTALTPSISGGFRVYVVSAVVTNNGRFLSASLITNGNTQVIVANQYGQFGLST